VKEFKLPGILKITSKRKPATKARPGRNPRTGEPITYAAKPAHNAVTVKALTKLKEWAN
jgi:nucleoid DNA-binding protein